ncbi:MAG TPA: ABC transporter permease, partial [Kribbella sp.]|nr:ABC transporter permease [Kribbella sp.]
MFLRRALRYRWSQALVLAGISLLIGTCAVFGPWFARAVEQTVMTETLTGQRLSAAWQLETSPTRTPSGTVPQPEDLTKLVPADLEPLFTKPVLGIHSDVVWRDADPSPVSRLLWREGYCDQIVVVAGRCPQGPNEVIASTVDKATWGAEPGAKINVVPDTSAGGGTLTVVGLYRPKDAGADYWFGRPPTGHSKPPIDKRPGETDYLLTDRTTFTPNVWGQHSTLDTRPAPGVARLDDLDRLEAASAAVQSTAGVVGADNTSGLVGVIDRIRDERTQAATIIPLVMVQVALFGLVVLALALAVVVDQR